MVDTPADVAVDMARPDVVDAATPADTRDARPDLSPDLRADMGPPALRIPTRPGVCTPKGLCWIKPDPIGSNLDHVWASGPDDIWVVADHACGSMYMHKNALDWFGVDCSPFPAAGALSGTASDDVWAISSDGTSVLRFDGMAWSKVDEGTMSRLRAVHAWAANDVIVVGNGGVIRRWNGTAWRTMASGTTADLTAVWISAANDIWVVADTLRRWDGVSWRTFATPAGVKKFWGESPDNVFAMTSGGISLWNGTSWASVGTRANMIDIQGGNEVLAIAAGATLSFDGAMFVVADSTNTPTTLTELSGGEPAGFFVAVGANGTVLRWSGGGWMSLADPLVPLGAPKQLRFSSPGKPWVVYGMSVNGEPVGTGQPVNAIAVVSDDDVWAVGEMGSVSHRVGGTWTASTVGAPVSLVDAWASTASNVWAISSTCQGYQWDGVRWTARPAPIGVCTTIWTGGPSDTWVGGDKLQRWNGSGWEDRAIPGVAKVISVWGTSATDVRAVAAGGAIYKWGGADWTMIAPSQGRLAGQSQAWVGPNDFWALDRMPGGDELFHWNGATSTWDGFSMPANFRPDVVGGSSPTDVRVHSASGILKYQP